MAYNNSTNNYATSRFIVGSSGQANYTTISAALTAASSGNTIFILPGTYTEDLTLKAGVNLVAYDADALTPNVTIIGKSTATFAGTCSLSGVRLQTNSDFFLVVSGSNATVVSITNCYLNCTNNTGISYTSSSSSAQIQISFTNGNIGTTGISLYSSTSSGNITFQSSTISNTGNATTASTLSSGIAAFYFSVIGFPLTTSSTGQIIGHHSVFDCSSTNTTAVTTAGTGTSTFVNCEFSSGTASVISVGSGTTVNSSENYINSSNTNAITGAGTINYGDTDFVNTSRIINTTTQNCFNSGTWSPVVSFGGSSTGVTYSTRVGIWTRYGNVCYFSFDIALTDNGSSTGIAAVSLPFTAANNGLIVSMFLYTTGFSAPASYAGSLMEVSPNTSSASLAYYTTAGISGNLTDTNITNSCIIRGTGHYFI